MKYVVSFVRGYWVVVDTIRGGGDVITREGADLTREQCIVIAEALNKEEK